METPRDLEARTYAAAILAHAQNYPTDRLRAAQVLALDAIADEIAALGALIWDLETKREAKLDKILSHIDKMQPPIDPESLIV